MSLVFFFVYLLLFNMQTDLLTVEVLRSILDEKLAPLKTEIAELRQFIDCASKKYDEVMTKLKEFRA